MIPEKQVGVGMLISNTIDFQPKVIKQDGEKHFISTKGKFYREEVSILKIYAPNARVAMHDSVYELM